jgi:hypothetical protein
LLSVFQMVQIPTSHSITRHLVFPRQEERGLEQGW